MISYHENADASYPLRYSAIKYFLTANRHLQIVRCKNVNLELQHDLKVFSLLYAQSWYNYSQRHCVFKLNAFIGYDGSTNQLRGCQLNFFFIQSHSNIKKRKSEKEENIIKINGRRKCCFAQIGRRALSSKQFPSIKYQLIFFLLFISSLFVLFLFMLFGNKATRHKQQ
jgi:hypothetical protein